MHFLPVVYITSVLCMLCRHPVMSGVGTRISFEEAFGKNKVFVESTFLRGARLLYENYYRTTIPIREEPLIPKIIHQIWLGSELPDRYKRLCETWKAKHPAWQHILWTDKEAAALTMSNRSLYESMKNYGAKADILRYEILYQYGGLYVDTDFECLKPFDQLHHRFDFFCGLSYIQKGLIEGLNGLIAAAPHHPVMQHCLKFLKKAAVVHGWDAIVDTTGPRMLMRAILKTSLRKLTMGTILPGLFFYPLSFEDRHKDFSYIKKTITPETFAIHYWDTSWT